MIVDFNFFKLNKQKIKMRLRWDNWENWDNDLTVKLDNGHFVDRNVVFLINSSKNTLNFCLFNLKQFNPNHVQILILFDV